MFKLVARAKVIGSATVTWLIAVSAAVQGLATDIASILPEEAERVGAVGVRVAAVLAVAVAIIRRVTTVLPDDRGLLPPGA